MKKLYHLHIPRTSGTGILYAMHQSIYVDREKRGFEQTPEQIPGIFEFSYNHQKMSDWLVISGHFAINPIFSNQDNIDTFSVVREPVDHFISLAAYVALSSKLIFNHKFLDDFINGNYDHKFGCKLFSSQGNLQTRMLTCRTISIVDVLGLDKSNNNIGLRDLNGIWFIDEDIPNSDSDLILKLEKIQLFELNERQNINAYLTQQFKTKFDIDFVGISPEKTNSSIRSGINPSPEQIREIEKRNYLDLVVYDYVCSRKK